MQALDDGGPEECLWRVISSDDLAGRPTAPELPSMEEEDSHLAVLNRAFIHEQSQMNLQGASPIDEVSLQDDSSVYSKANAAPFSITEMLGSNEPNAGRKT